MNYSARLFFLGVLVFYAPFAQPVNSPPIAQLVRPVNTAAYSGESVAIPFNVLASDPDGIAKVDFYVGTVLYGTMTTAPFSALLTVPPGAYAFSARATDTLGAVTTTATANINVYAAVPSNTAPSATMLLPINSSTYEAPASVPVAVDASDSGGAINRVEFYVDGSYLDTRINTPYSGTRNGVPAGTYAFTAKAYDSLGMVATSAANTVTVFAPDPTNSAPTVSLISPINGKQYLPSELIAVTADASDIGGINRVEFFVNGGLHTFRTTPPFSFNTYSTTDGAYQFVAVAYDNQGKRTISTAKNVIVTTPPTVSLIAPANNRVYPAPAGFTLEANAADTGGSIARVEFYSGATKIGEDTTAPYSWAISGLAAGTYTYSAKAIDNLGSATLSTPISVISNALPTATLTAPVAGTYTALRPIQLAATASDAGGSIAKVEFFDGATLIGAATVPPFVMNWTNMAAGVHSITAKATDNLDGIKASAAVSINVNATNTAPVVGISTPLNNDILNLPSTVTIKANATDLEKNDGIKEVAFYAGTTLLYTDTTSPYEYVWSPASGVYNLTTKAMDNSGTITTSVAINYIANNLPSISLSVPQILGGYTAPANIALNATVNDSDGTISRVEFYSGTTLIKTAITPPYTFNYPGVVAGSHNFTAKVFDNRNAATTSNTVAIPVSGALSPVTYTYDELGRLIRVLH